MFKILNSSFEEFDIVSTHSCLILQIQEELQNLMLYSVTRTFLWSFTIFFFCYLFNLLSYLIENYLTQLEFILNDKWHY